GDEVAVARAEEDHRPDQVLRHLDALEGAPAQARLAELQDFLARVLLAERRAGGERVHVDVVVAQLAGERAGEAHHAGLGGDVVGARAAAAVEDGARGDVDDLPLAALAHVGHYRAAAQPGTLEVDLHQAVPLLDRDLLEADPRHGDGREDRRVVDQDVDAAEPIDGAVSHGLGGFLVRDVGLDGERLAAHLGDLLRHGLGRPAVDVGHDHLRALARHAQAVGAADPVAAARHDGYFVLEPHVVLLRPDAPEVPRHARGALARPSSRAARVCYGRPGRAVN